MAELTQDIDHTKGPLEVRDYGEPVLLAAAECQFALLDGPDGAPVAYVYREEDVRLYAAAPDLLEDGGFLIDRLDEFESDLKDDAVARQFYGHVSPALARLRAAISRANGADQ